MTKTHSQRQSQSHKHCETVCQNVKAVSVTKTHSQRQRPRDDRHCETACQNVKGLGMTKTHSQRQRQTQKQTGDGGKDKKKDLAFLYTFDC